MKKLTIVTINYNNVEGLKKTLSSIVAQSAFNKIHHLIIDGGSNDGSQEVLNDYCSYNISAKVISEKDDGIYFAMNKGLTNCNTEYIAFLNSGDVLYAEDTIKELINIFNNSYVPDIIYSDLQIHKAENIYRDWRSGKFFKYKLYFGWMPPHPMCIINSKLLKILGKFDTKLKIAADYKLLLKAFLTKKLNIIYFPHFTVKMEGGGISNGSIRNIIRANIEVLIAWTTINRFIIPIWIPITKPLMKLKQIKIN